MEKCLKQLANNQVVVCEYIDYGETRYEFYSYNRLIAVFYTSNGETKESLRLTDLYDYSRTTSKWLKVFLNDICGFYYENTKELKKYIAQGGTNNVVIQVV